MRIEADLKLGFKDVMIRPKRSTLRSCAQVSLGRRFNFLHSGKTWAGVPIMAANMDTIGTFEMAAALAKAGLLTAIHKHYSPQDWDEFLTAHPGIEDHLAVSTGTAERDLDTLKTVLGRHPSLYPDLY